MKKSVILAGGAAGFAVVLLVANSLPENAGAPEYDATQAHVQSPLPTPKVAVAPPERVVGNLVERVAVEPLLVSPPANPWSPEELAGALTDAQGFPVEQSAFLHTMMVRGGDGQDVKDGRSSFYQFDFDSFLAGLPPDIKTRAQGMRAELMEEIADYDKGAREFEKQQWMVRYDDYHRAVELGNFLIVDTSGVSELEAAVKIGAAREALGLGMLNRDYVYIISSARPPDGRAYADGRFTAVIYVRRNDFPRSFELMNEIARTVNAAENTVRARLGVPR